MDKANILSVIAYYHWVVFVWCNNMWHSINLTVWIGKWGFNWHIKLFIVTLCVSFINWFFLHNIVHNAWTFLFSFLFFGVSHFSIFSQVDILSECSTLFAFIFFFDTGFLILSGWDGVIFDSGFGTSNNLGMASHICLFLCLWIVTLPSDWSIIHSCTNSVKECL